MERPILKTKAEVTRNLAESTFRRALECEGWGMPVEAGRLLERALALEADAQRYEAQAKAK